eukprot:TRINITY_DN6550_c0_g2_i1.p1 TRINITY_DN6550_c0_g2~~TRINITY_DN6550_c0_g2_i1.p1  ORF type:complete len:645 (-),score=95.10 TRINITY_DN6550_c0_g2_i1:67-2001(-)
MASFVLRTHFFVPLCVSSVRLSADLESAFVNVSSERNPWQGAASEAEHTSDVASYERPSSDKAHAESAQKLPRLSPSILLGATHAAADADVNRVATRSGLGVWGADDEQAPDLDRFARLFEERLARLRRGRGQLASELKAGTEACGGGWKFYDNNFLSGCSADTATSSEQARRGANCQQFKSLDEAKQSCDLLGAECGGVISSVSGGFECRKSAIPATSQNGESAHVKLLCGGLPLSASPNEIVEEFQKTVQEAIDDPSYRLNGQRRHLLSPGHAGDPASVKDDGTIFLTVAAYRDWNCDETVAQALRHASRPDRVHVAIVEMNCRVEPCVTGTGWGASRRIVPVKPDEDCYDELMQKTDIRHHLEAGRVKTLRLNETQALGPFFSRFLAMNMFEGQSYIVQVDAHSKFLEDWDALVIAQLKRTPSFPRSIISNYPPPALPSSSTPTALCNFEFANGIVRLQQGVRSFLSKPDDSPRHSMYVAAGFLAAHSSLLTDCPFDPYLPFIFMGEEITMSTRFWTSGWDIYAPSQDVVSHEYVRKESPKYWETVDRLYGDGTQNAVVPIVLQRIRHLLEWPDDPPVQPPNLLFQLSNYGLGKSRPLRDFWENGGVDLKEKKVKSPTWCSVGTEPTHVSVLLSNSSRSDP